MSISAFEMRWIQERPAKSPPRPLSANDAGASADERAGQVGRERHTRRAAQQMDRPGARNRRELERDHAGHALRAELADRPVRIGGSSSGGSAADPIAGPTA